MRSFNCRWRRKRTRGVTLTEILLAIFIASVGLLALLELIPVGMLEMAQAIRDDRQSQLQDTADELTAAAQQIEISAAELNALYAGWLQQQRVDEKQADLAALILQSHEDELSSIGQKVRERLPQLSRSDRQLARRVLALLREGQSVIRALQRKLNLILKIQHALDLSSGPNDQD